MTEQELRQRLKEPDFAIGFVLDNNPTAVFAKLRSLGFFPVDKPQAAAIIKRLAMQGNSAAISAIFSVPYVNEATNGTGGFRNLFIQESPPPTAEEKGAALREAATAASGGSVASTTQPSGMSPLWSGVLTFATSGLAGLLVPKQPQFTADQLAQQQAAQKAAEEAERQKERNILIAVISVIALIVIIALIIAFTGKKKSA